MYKYNIHLNDKTLIYAVFNDWILYEFNDSNSEIPEHSFVIDQATKNITEA